MSNRDLTLSMKLYADATRFVHGLATGERGVKRFTSGAKAEFQALGNMLGSVEGKLASIGVTIGVTQQIMRSARLDKELTQIGQTAGEGSGKVAQLRSELWRLNKETGQEVENLKDGFNNAVQAGLSFNEALPVIDATNIAMAVTSARADVLSGALTVAATAFDFDLTKPNQALNILDKMTVAGRLGNAELENLSSIFGRIGPNAASANMSFDQTLAFVEGLSMIERQPERLATLADSTLRLFTNLRYMKEAQKATRVKFFDADGTRRDAMAVLADIKTQYDKLVTEKQRALFMQRAFGSADLDTIKGLRILLSGDMLTKVGGFATEISGASGVLKQDLQEAINNSVDQVGRLKGALGEAADEFSRPINATLANVIKYSMDTKENGGLGMDGKDMLAAAGIGIGGTALAARYGGKLIGGLASKFGSVGTGVATGKALEAAAGVTPVYVVNMPGDLGGIAGMAGGTAGAATVAKTASKFKTAAALLGGSNLGALPMMGAGAMGAAGLAVGAAGLAGWGVGSLINKGIEGTVVADTIGRTIAMIMAPFSKNAREALSTEFQARAAELKGTLNIKVDQDGRVTGATMTSNQPGIRTNVDNGPYMVMAY